MERFDLLLQNLDLLKEGVEAVSKQVKEENEEFFNAIVENSVNLIAIIQNDKFAFINSRGLKLFKARGSADIIGKRFIDTIDSDLHHNISSYIIGNLTNVDQTVQIKFKNLDGDPFVCECNLTPFIQKNKKALLISGKNISDEILHKEKLLFEEKLRTDILNAFKEVVAFYSPDHRFLWVNDAGKKQLNIQDDLYVGKLCYKLWFNSNKPCNTCPVAAREIKATERTIKFDDNSIWMIRNIPMFDKQGILTGYIEFRSDITEKETIKIELEESHTRQIRAELINNFGHFEVGLSGRFLYFITGHYEYIGFNTRKKRLSTR
jgi:PAS domain S-box-containing protein